MENNIINIAKRRNDPHSERKYTMQNKLPKRDEVAAELTWRLEDIYEDEAKWEEELNKATEVADKMATFAGTLSEGAEKLYELCKLNEDLELVLDRVYGYAHMREDQDTTNSKYQGFHQRAMSVYAGAGEKTAFMSPEILSLSDEKLNEYYAKIPELDRYKRMIGEIRRLKDHMLDSERAASCQRTGDAGRIPEVLWNAGKCRPQIPVC